MKMTLRYRRDFSMKTEVIISAFQLSSLFGDCCSYLLHLLFTDHPKCIIQFECSHLFKEFLLKGWYI